MYRIGQEKETYLANLTIRNTIEDKMTDIKKRKDTEIDGCMENHKNNVARRGLELSYVESS